MKALTIPRTLDELESLVKLGEQRHLEFKESVSDKGAIRKVVRAVAAMSNLREGGLVILGVEDKTTTLRGLPEADRAHWGDTDKARSTINAFVDPAVYLRAHTVGSCVILDVDPFTRTPIIARLSKGESHQPNAIVEGALYYRSSVTTSSAPISRLEDWNELRETLLIRTSEGVRRLDEESRRTQQRAQEDRIREILGAAKATFVPHRQAGPNPSRALALINRNRRLFQIRAQQAEAKANLRAIYTSFVAYFHETDRYPESILASHFQPQPNGRYVYRAIEGEILGAEKRSDRAEIVAEGHRLLKRYDAQPHIGARSFLVMAATLVEPENLLDVWIVDRFGDPRCLTPETTDLEARRTKHSFDEIQASIEGVQNR